MDYKSNFDIIKCSKELKKLIRQRVGDLGYSLKYVCDNSGVNYDKFRYYLSAENPLDKHISYVKQSHILKVCDQLGIFVKVKIIIQDEKKTKEINSQRKRYE